jgi:Fe-S oxidoreductase
MVKLTEQEKIEINNAIEKAKEMLSKCIKCGMCKSLCPVFKVLKEESVSARGHSIYIEEEVLERTLFQCNLCKACEQNCPVNLKICEAVREARFAFNKKKKELKTNEEMMKNIRKNGNPFGGKKPEGDKLYCC